MLTVGLAGNVHHVLLSKAAAEGMKDFLFIVVHCSASLMGAVGRSDGGGERGPLIRLDSLITYQLYSSANVI